MNQEYIPQQTKKSVNYKGAIAFLCVLCMLLLISNIGLVVYILMGKNNVLDVNKTYDTFITLQDAIDEDDFDLDNIRAVVSDYQEQGIVSGYEEQENGILIESSDGVNYLYTEDDNVNKTESLSVSVVNPAEDNAAGEKQEDFSFFDDTNDSKFIHWDGHIVFTHRFGPVFRTNIRVNDKDVWKQYAKELRNREIIAGRHYFYLCPSYFRNHIRANGMRNSIFILHNNDSVRDNRLLQVLFEKGIGLVLILDSTMEKDLQKELATQFMKKLSERGEDGNFRSAKDCYALVWEQFCKDHADFADRENTMQMNFPEGKDDYRLPKATTPGGADSAQQTTTAATEPVNTITPAILPEEAVEIYNNAFSQWEINKENYSCNYYYYGFLDFDFDGVLELVATINAGTAHNSTNSYFRIDPATKSVKEIENKEKIFGEAHLDLIGNTVLYRNNDDKSVSYYSENSSSGGAFGGSNSFCSLWYENGAIHSDEVHSSAKFREETTGPYTQKYTYNNKEVSEAEYNTLVEKFAQENTNLNLQWEPCKGDNIRNATKEQRKQLLLSAYNSFRYDGFSFDNIKTEPTTQPEPTTADDQFQAVASPLTVEKAEYTVAQAQKMVVKWITGAQYSTTQTIRRGTLDYGLVPQTKAEMKAELCAYLHESYFDEIFETYYIEQDGKIYYRIGGFGLEGAFYVVRSDLTEKADTYDLTMRAVYFDALGGTQKDEKRDDIQLTFVNNGGNWVIDDLGKGGYWMFTGIYFVTDLKVTMPDTLTNPTQARMDSFGNEDGMSVNMRTGPGTNNSIIKKVPDNSKIYVCGTSEEHPDWSFICYLGDFGWTINSCIFY